MAEKFSEFQIETVDYSNIGFVQSHVQLYQCITDSINNSIDSINRKFYQIGLLLFLSKVTKNYCINGFKDIYEYAENTFNLKRTTTKNLIKIVEKFSSEKLLIDIDNDKINNVIYDINYQTYYLDNKYREYSYSQLLEMTKLNDEEIEEIEPNMSVRQIKELIVDKKVNEFLENEEKEYLDLFEELKRLFIIYCSNVEFVSDFKQKYTSSFQFSYNFKVKVRYSEPVDYIYVKLKYIRTLSLDNRYPQVEFVLTDQWFKSENKTLMQVSVNDDKIYSYFENVCKTSFLDYLKRRENYYLDLNKKKITEISNNDVEIIEPNIVEEKIELTSYDEYRCDFDEYFILKTFVENNNITKDDKIYNDKNNEFKSLINDNKLKFAFYYNDSDYFDISKNDKCYHIDKLKFFNYLAQKMKELNIGYDSYIDDKIDEVIVYEKN